MQKTFKIKKNQIKIVHGYVTKEKHISILLKRFYFNSQNIISSIRSNYNDNFDFKKISETIYQITSHSGLSYIDNLFILKSGKKKIKYSLISI